MQRAFDENEPELMDRPQPVTAELEQDLANLVSLNRYFGSHRVIRKFLDCWVHPDRSYRILDLATGSGDIPRLILDWSRQRQIAVRVDAIDTNSSTLEIARKLSTGYPEIDFIRADARRFESDQTYDLVCCSLALHHFSEADAIRVLRRCSELSHRYALVVDLERSLTTLAGVYAVTALVYRDPMTKFDGRLSARRAFSFSELRAMAEIAGWKNFGQTRFLFCRQAIWFDTRQLAEIPEVVLPESDGLPCPT